MENKTINSIIASRNDYPYLEDRKHKLFVNKKLYKQILFLFMKKLVYYLITTNERIQLPSRLGSFKLYRYNTNMLKKNIEKVGGTFRKKVDFLATKKLKDQGINKVAYHLNKSTNGYWWKLIWHKFEDANFKHKKMFSFKLSRPNSRPNSYNKNNPEVSIVPYFQEKGWKEWSEIPFHYHDKKDKKEND